MDEKTFPPDDSPFVVDTKTWSPEELSSLVLRKLKQMAEHFGQPLSKAVITVPAYFGEPERAATRDAGELAGLEVVRIINEPKAAALAHGVDQGGDAGKVLVFDLGGGSFDVTVMEVGSNRAMEEIATGGDRRPAARWHRLRPAHPGADRPDGRRSDVTPTTVTIEILATLPNEPGFDYTPNSDVSITGTR
jgi:hypothetical protein